MRTKIQASSEPTKFNEYYRAQELTSPAGALGTYVPYLPPRFVADFLVSAFFKHAEGNYFFVRKSWLAAKVEAAYLQDMSSLNTSTICIILMVLAIGTQHAYLDSPITERPASIDGAKPSPGAFSEDTLGVSFYQQACKLLSDIITISSLESVQATLLIGLYTLPLDASGLSYVYLNLAVRLAIQNGMHRQSHHKASVDATSEQSNWVWWTACTMERCVFGTPPLQTITDDQLEDVLPSSTEDHLQLLPQTLTRNGRLC